MYLILTGCMLCSVNENTAKMTRKHKAKGLYAVSVAVFALLSRLSVILMQVIVGNLLPDHHADAFHLDPVPNPSASDEIVHFLVDGFTKWDASYFLHIAQHGYTKPQMFAFFPLYPSLVRVLTDFFVMPVQNLFSLHMSLYSCVVLSAVTLNICFFCSAAILLYYLGVRVLSSQKLAYKAALLFCINPASVFMTAAYTESLFASLSFAGMLALECDRFLGSAILFALSGAARSNGFISIGFLVYFAMRKIADLLIDVKCQRQKSGPVLWQLTRCHVKYIVVIVSILPLTMLIVIVLLPFISFQVYTFMMICTDERNIPSFLTINVPVSDHGESWCYKNFPIPYSEIQSKHWNVGFLRYYEFKKFPNFLLAFPMVVLCADAILKYCKKRWHYVCVLGLVETQKVRLETRTIFGKSGLDVFGNKLFVHIVHLAALLGFGVTCMHVQVVTRFISSSCPIVFWYAAHLTTDENTETSQPQRNQRDTTQNIPAFRGNISLFDISKNELIVQYMKWREQGLRTKLVLGYFAGYCLIGIVMHCNFLPWT
ncbi:GPI mannosyltransferase 2-like [Patiria miniata]|uniref:GPI mannosyltransferase 2 n=1 Tax=Patiria miniata TaxID=46514 RepID=A0A913ZNA8_PATMI|nr:GPI mannosyltransferase 2-like [Patiria miniata]